MHDLLTARRYLGRIRATTMAIALVAVLFTAPRVTDVHVILFVIGVVIAQVAVWLLGSAHDNPNFLRGIVAVDLVLLAAANSLSETAVFPLLVVPIMYIGAWMPLLDAAWAVILASGLYALSSPAPETQPSQIVSAALHAAVLGMVGAAANRMAGIHRGARRRWRALVDLPSRGRGLSSIEDTRLLAEVLDGLLGAEYALLFTMRDGALTLDEARIALSAEESDIAQGLGQTDLAAAALQSGRPIAVPDCMKEPRLPRELASQLGLHSVLAVPLHGVAVGQALIVLVNRSHGVPYEGDDAGVARLVVSSTLALQTGATPVQPETSSPDVLLTAAMKTVFEAGDAGAIIIDGEGRIVTFNHVAEQLLLLRNELVGETVDLGIEDVAVRELIVESVELEAPRTLRSAPVAAAWGEAEAIPLFVDEERIGTVVLVTPKDDHATRDVVDDVLSCVSHELKTPLTAIRAYIDTLLMGASFDEETRCQFLGIARDQTRRLSDAVDALLAAAEKGEPAVDDGAPVTLADSVRSALNDLSYCTEDHDIKTELLDDSPSVDIPATVVRASIHHLLLDALTRAARGGAVAISETRREDSAVLTIEFVPDPKLGPGGGVSGAPMSLVDAGPRPGGGLGLGLFLARRTLEPMGGRVEADYTEGSRVQWTLTVPILA